MRKYDDLELMEFICYNAVKYNENMRVLSTPIDNTGFAGEENMSSEERNFEYQNMLENAVTNDVAEMFSLIEEMYGQAGVSPDLVARFTDTKLKYDVQSFADAYKVWSENGMEAFSGYEDEDVDKYLAEARAGLDEETKNIIRELVG